MRKFIILASLAASLTSGALAGGALADDAGKAPALSPVFTGAYEMDKGHASLLWKVQHMGLAYYTARFTDFDVDLNFDAAHPEKSTLTASINPVSVRTSHPWPEKEDFDAVLGTDKKWFNANVYPKIVFKATGIDLTSDNTGKVTGDLTFLGVTKPVTLDVTLSGSQEKRPFAGVPALGFSARANIKRSDWGFTTYAPAIVGDDVQIIIEAEFLKPKATD